MHLKTKREFGVEMCCLREVILQSIPAFARRQQKPAFSAQFDYHIDR